MFLIIHKKIAETVKANQAGFGPSCCLSRKLCLTLH